jgi:small nuclear ribonucleoprotein (snRNP)-like protein
MAASTKFGDEVLAFLNKKVYVETSEGRIYKGKLVAIDEKMDLILDNIENSDGVSRMILNGSFVKEVKLLEKSFDLHALAERLNNVFPGLVKVRDDIAAIIVMDKIKVTERGVVEGSGLAAERAKAIYDEFVKETGK